jgi:serine/threonine protein kinase
VPVPKTTNSAENVFIFNEIKIERPEQVIAQELPVGGGCLKVMAVSASYVGGAGTATRGGDPVFLQKALVAKSARGESSRQQGKVQHERNIVRLFSSAHSGYLLKYYACNQSSFALRHSLLMDYHAGTVALLDHLQLRRESLSVEGKLTLLAHLSNGLRFLAYYKVVHMDLTLTNILVYDGYLPKIIDFGEAYHRETIEATVKTAYAPGFTLPYCAPEVFKNKEFSPAQDMFSFGMIIYRLLLNALPIFPADSLVGVYRAGDHHSRFFLAPEGLAAVCQQRVCFLLLQLVNLCLRAQEDGRPLPIWTTIVLKEILTEVFL